MVLVMPSPNFSIFMIRLLVSVEAWSKRPDEAVTRCTTASAFYIILCGSGWSVNFSLRHCIIIHYLSLLLARPFRNAILFRPSFSISRHASKVTWSLQGVAMVESSLDTALQDSDPQCGELYSTYTTKWSMFHWLWLRGRGGSWWRLMISCSVPKCSLSGIIFFNVFCFSHWWWWTNVQSRKYSRPHVLGEATHPAQEDDE